MDQDHEREICEAYYTQAVAGAVSDDDELEIAMDLLDKAKRGQVPNDAGTGLIYAQVGKLPVDADWMVEGHNARQRKQQVRQILLIAGGLLAAIVFVIVTSSGNGKGKGTATPTAPAEQGLVRPISIATQTLTPLPVTATSSITPTPTPTPTAIPSPVPAKEVEVKAIVPTLEPGAVVPVSLEAAGRYYPIVPTTLRGDAWAFEPDPGRVSWLTGSYVNIVLGLPYSEANLNLVATTLHVSDTLTLRNNVAGVNHYQVVSRQSVSVYEIEALAQRRAGLTLVLVGGNDENSDSRLIIWAVSQPGKEVSAP